MVGVMANEAVQLDLTTTPDGVAASGVIDAHTAPKLAEALADAGFGTSLDMSNVSFIDSSGLRVLVDAHARSEEAGASLVLTNPSSSVEKLFRISGLEGYLNVHS